MSDTESSKGRTSVFETVNEGSNPSSVICPRCERDDVEFGVRASGRRQAYCVECTKEYGREWHQKNKEKRIPKLRQQKKQRLDDTRNQVYDFMGEVGCADCGNKDLRVLEFDHILEKVDNVSAMIAHGRPWDVIQDEMKKCEIVCANCHKIRTFTEI